MTSTSLWVRIGAGSSWEMEPWAKAARMEGHYPPMTHHERNMAERGAREAMRSLKPGDRLPGGLVVREDATRSPISHVTFRPATDEEVRDAVSAVGPHKAR